MTTPVIIDFQAGGIRDVAQAFRTIEQSVVQLERRLSRSTAETERLQKRTAKETERATREAAKAKEKAEKEASALATKLIKEEAKVAAQSHKERERLENQYIRIRENSARMAGRIYAQQAREEERIAKQSAATRERYARMVGGSFGRAVGRTAAVIGGASALIGGFGVMDSLQRETRYRGSLADLANSSYQPGDSKYGNNALKSSSYLNGVISPAAIKYGYQKDEAAEGLQRFVSKTGRLDMGEKTLERMAQLARATGSSLSDLADAAGDAFNSNQNMDAEELMNIMGAIAGQGKLGAVEVKDLASQMAKLQAAARQFSGDRQQNLIKMGVLTQVARAQGGASSAEEAATSTQRFASDLMGMSKKKAHGLNFTNKDGTLKDPLEILQMIMKTTGGNATTINDMFGERGVRVASGFADIYRTAEANQKGSGEAAVRAEFLKLEKAALDQQQIKLAADKRMAEVDMKLEQAMARLREAVAIHLLPKLEQLMPKLEQLIPKFGELLTHLATVVEFLVNHPFAGIFAIIAAQVAKDIIAAKIGDAIVAAITRSGGGGGGTGGAGGAGGKRGSLVDVVGAIAIAKEGYQGAKDSKEWVDALYKGQGTTLSALTGLGVGGQSYAKMLQQKAAAGTLTEEDRAGASQYMQSIQKSLSAKKEQDGSISGQAHEGWSTFIATVSGNYDTVKQKSQAMAEATVSATTALEQLERVLSNTADKLADPGAKPRNDSMTDRQAGGTQR